ncbi:MAG: family 43 glycosylhydrolase [Candidatus Hydrogenedens sp.]|nr:family 43 glycosylhydrolase [Candidatus Hydrogenedens sp.]
MLSLFVTCLLSLSAVAADDSVLLFSYFTGNGEDGLHFAASEDGLEWKALRDGAPVLAPAVGKKEQLIRDPCIAQGPDATYHMVWTPGWQERGIGYAHSKDLRHWSEQRWLPVMEHIDDARNAWAPELFYDAARERWLIFWASTVPSRFPAGKDNPEGEWNHRMYFTETRDFETFTEAALLYDQGFSVIDSTMVRTDDGYAMFLKDETRLPPQKNIRGAHADNPAGPWSAPSAPITGDYWAEGPTAIRWDGRWLVYFDKYQDHRYGVVASTDLEHWEDWSDRLHMPDGLRHGTVFRVPRGIAEGLAGDE